MPIVRAVSICNFPIVEPVDLVHRRDKVDAEVHQGDHLVLAHENVESPRSLWSCDFFHKIEQRIAHGLEFARQLPQQSAHDQIVYGGAVFAQLGGHLVVVLGAQQQQPHQLLKVFVRGRGHVLGEREILVVFLQQAAVGGFEAAAVAATSLAGHFAAFVLRFAANLESGQFF